MKCPKCGEENKKQSNFCSVCGAKLKSDSNEKHNRTGKQNSVSNTNGGKIIKKSTIYQIISVLFVIVLLNLYFSGVFDEPSAEVSQREMTSDSHGGVDLSKLEEIKNLEAKVKANSADYESMLQLARSYSEAGFAQKAIVSYENYLNGIDNDNNVCLEFSHYLHDNGQWQKAIDNYEVYLKQNPSNADVLVDQGVCYFSLKDYKNAKRVMQKALQYDKNHLFAHFNLGIVSLNEGNTKEGIEWMKKVIELEPNSQMAKQAQKIIDSNNKGG